MFRTVRSLARTLTLGTLGIAALTARTTHAQQPASATPVPPQAAVAAAQPAPPAIAPRKAPAINRVNESLPKWLTLRAEFRERVEGFENLGFTEGRDDAFALTRVRFNVTAVANKHLSFQVNLHDARLSGKQVGPTAAPFRGPFDLRTGFTDIGSTASRVTVRVGRQELAFGEQRLIGHLAWVNTGRAFDAARATLRSKKAGQVDVFAASLVRNLPDSFDKSGNGNRLFGAYASTPKLIPLAAVEPFVFVRRDENLRSEAGTLGTILQTTVGTRVAGRLPARLDYGVEMALQRGSLAADSISAWAGHWQVRESLPGRLAVKLTSEYNFASGDANATDGTRATFDQLYPTGHDKLGLGDQVGWKNVHHIREGFEVSPFKATPISLNYHSWWLASTTDGLYGANGALLARVAGGAASSHVGHEIDVQVSRAVTPQLQVTGGYAHMFTGAFLRQATPGASYSTPYVMATYVLLADK
jgi:hypothetical protein